MILISELFGESLWTSCCFMGRHSKVFSVDVRSLTIVLCKHHLSAWFSLYQMLCSTSTVSLLKNVLETDVRKTHLWLNFIIPHYRVKLFMAETLHVRDGESTDEINKLKSWECLPMFAIYIFKYTISYMFIYEVENVVRNFLTLLTSSLSKDVVRPKGKSCQFQWRGNQYGKRIWQAKANFMISGWWIYLRV